MISNAISSIHYAINHCGLVTNELVSTAAQTTTLSRVHDSFQRPLSLSLSSYPTLSYTYTTENDLATVSNSIAFAKIQYRPDGFSVGYNITLANGNTFTQSLTRHLYRRELVRTITNTFNDTPRISFSYKYDLLGQPTNRIDNGIITNWFTYNERSEILSASLCGVSYSYDYDDIGNWIQHPINALNQYTSIQGVPLSYDPDGNLLSYGPWTLTWDAENRLSTVSSNGILLVTNQYDPYSRRVQKMTPTETHTYVYDGWNIVLETIAYADGSTNTLSYVWGPDLSGSPQGAGGVGGLLWLTLNNLVYLPCYDANGNIVAYLDDQGNTAASYAYDPYGNLITSSGPLAHFFTHRFSTKCFDPETSLYYYGYRFYSPSMGRWLNRDPIEEIGGRNLYAFVRNNSFINIDFLGHIKIYIGGAYEETGGQLDEFRKYTGCDVAFNYMAHKKNFEYIRKRIAQNPCESIVLVGHSYGGDTAMDIADMMNNDNNLKCCCLYIITLDPVSHLDPDTWFLQNPSPDNVREWVNVYQRAGVVDSIVSIPVVGWAIGGLWSLTGVIIGNNNMVATGGRQWNTISGPDIRLNGSNIDHHGVADMMKLKLTTSDEHEIALKAYINELNRRNCCEEK